MQLTWTFFIFIFKVGIYMFLAAFWAQVPGMVYTNFPKLSFMFGSFITSLYPTFLSLLITLTFFEGWLYIILGLSLLVFIFWIDFLFLGSRLRVECLAILFSFIRILGGCGAVLLFFTDVCWNPFIYGGLTEHSIRVIQKSVKEVLRLRQIFGSDSYGDSLNYLRSLSSRSLDFFFDQNLVIFCLVFIIFFIMLFATPTRGYSRSLFGLFVVLLVWGLHHIFVFMSCQNLAIMFFKTLGASLFIVSVVVTYLWVWDDNFIIRILVECNLSPLGPRSLYLVYKYLVNFWFGTAMQVAALIGYMLWKSGTISVFSLSIDMLSVSGISVWTIYQHVCVFLLWLIVFIGFLFQLSIVDRKLFVSLVCTLPSWALCFLMLIFICPTTYMFTQFYNTYPIDSFLLGVWAKPLLILWSLIQMNILFISFFIFDSPTTNYNATFRVYIGTCILFLLDFFIFITFCCVTKGGVYLSVTGVFSYWVIWLYIIFLVLLNLTISFYTAEKDITVSELRYFFSYHIPGCVILFLVCMLFTLLILVFGAGFFILIAVPVKHLVLVIVFCCWGYFLAFVLFFKAFINFFWRLFTPAVITSDFFLRPLSWFRADSKFTGFIPKSHAQLYTILIFISYILLYFIGLPGVWEFFWGVS